METVENKGFVYEFGNFVLDPHEKTLFADGVAMHLPPKEFETLLLLVEHNGHALTKEAMMSAIWQDAFVEESNLAKQISRLRKFFNTNGNEFIETIPKHGYRFTADLRRVAASNESAVIAERRIREKVSIELTSDAQDVQTPLYLPTAKRTFRTWQKIILAAAFATIGFSIYLIWQKWNQPAQKINSIAVLPLRALNGDQDAKVLGLGLTDALITKLGSLRRVVVRPTNAVASFSDQSDPLETGQRLNVDAVFEGTIQQADGRLRVHARLLQTVTGEQIWSDKFDQPAAGLFALQDALSASIAKTLAFELSKSDSEQLLKRGTENSEAYEKYLRGRFFQSQNTAEGLNRSIEFYEQAVALDPNFAEAHAGIADANVILFNFGIRAAEETIPQARQEINRAMQLNQNLSNAFTSLALIQFLIDYNWPEAEKSLQRAIELDSNNADAFHRHGYFLMRLGRFDEALEKFDKALEINPLSAISQSDKGLTFLCARRYPQAIEQLEKTAAENPTFSFPTWLLADSYEAAGDEEKALDVNLKALEIEGGSELAARLREVRNAEGIGSANRLWLDESMKARASRHVSALEIAMRAATAKDREQTLFWVERALDEGDARVVGIKFLPKFDFVRNDARFQAVVDKIVF